MPNLAQNLHDFAARMGTDMSSRVNSVDSLVNLAAAGNKPPMFLSLADREGLFNWRAGDYSTLVTADTPKGVYVPATGNPSGSTGAWVRAHDGSLNAKWFGAKGDGVTDDTDALNGAIRTGRHVWVPPGVYKTSAKLLLNNDGQKLIGAGMGTTTIISASTTANVVEIAANTEWIEVAGMTLDRSVVASTADPTLAGGLSMAGYANHITLHDLHVQNHCHGLWLRSTDFSRVYRVISQKNYGTGLVMRGSLTPHSTTQWYLDDVLLSMNDGLGLLSDTLPGGASQASVGTMSRIWTWANSAGGVAVVADPSCPIHGVRMTNCFLGEDGNYELYLETYGEQHRINGVFAELAGARTTGRLLTTAATTGVGPGIHITVNNVDAMITGGSANGNQQSGIWARASLGTHVSGTRMRNNGGVGLLGEDGNKVMSVGNFYSGNGFGERNATSNPTILVSGVNTVGDMDA